MSFRESLNIVGQSLVSAFDWAPNTYATDAYAARVHEAQAALEGRMAELGLLPGLMPRLGAVAASEAAPQQG